jgi:hypothetical protein
MTQPGGGSFAVDFARAPKAIRELEDALEELRRIRQDATLLAQVTPPTRDQVSLDAARALSLTAQGGPSSFTDALEGGIGELSRMIDALRSGFEHYRGSDAEAATDLRSVP